MKTLQAHIVVAAKSVFDNDELDILHGRLSFHDGQVKRSRKFKFVIGQYEGKALPSMAKSALKEVGPNVIKKTLALLQSANVRFAEDIKINKMFRGKTLSGGVCYVFPYLSHSEGKGVMLVTINPDSPLLAKAPKAETVEEAPTEKAVSPKMAAALERIESSKKLHTKARKAANPKLIKGLDIISAKLALSYHGVLIKPEMVQVFSSTDVLPSTATRAALAWLGADGDIQKHKVTKVVTDEAKSGLSGPNTSVVTVQEAYSSTNYVLLFATVKRSKEENRDKRGNFSTAVVILNKNKFPQFDAEYVFDAQSRSSSKGG